MKKTKYTKAYGIFGKVLCGCAGAAIGFVLGGVGFAILGVLPGVLLGHFLETTVTRVA